MTTAGRVIGIDVAKKQLEIATRPGGTRWAVANDPPGVAGLVERLRGEGAVTLIVVEATGGYELAVVAALTLAALPVVVVNPRQVRDFARATGQLAKTDVLDAAILAHFGEAVRPTPRPLPDELTQGLQGWMARRRQLLEMLQAERNRLELAAPAVRPAIQHISSGRANTPAPSQALAHAAAPQLGLAAHDDLLRSLPGRPRLATTLLAEVPDSSTHRQHIAKSWRGPVERTAANTGPAADCVGRLPFGPRCTCPRCRGEAHPVSFPSTCPVQCGHKPKRSPSPPACAALTS